MTLHSSKIGICCILCNTAIESRSWRGTVESERMGSINDSLQNSPMNAPLVPFATASGPIDAALAQRMTDWRHDIHVHPETAFEEHRTANLVATALQLMGMNVDRGLGGTGVVGTLRHGSGPTIALRADMDALHLQELGSPAYKSCTAGKMHACGHDGHTAMLLGAAQYLAAHPEFAGTVHFIFQPAEENEGGGRKMIEDGLFDRFPVQAVYGMHNMPQIPQGHFAIRPGPMMASQDNFEITVTGKGAHGAQPETGIDPVVAAAQLVNLLQTIPSRRTAALDALVVSVTQIHGGDAWNIIPETVVLRGTVRAFKGEVRDRAAEFMQEACAGLSTATGASIKLDYMRCYPALVNHAAETRQAADAATALVGADKVDRDCTPIMSSEDFSFMLEAQPGAYIFIGSGRTGKDPSLHNPYYDFNDAILPLGAAYWVKLVETVLPA